MAIQEIPSFADSPMATTSTVAGATASVTQILEDSVLGFTLEGFDFVGFDTTKADDLYQEFENYVQELNAIVDAFNSQGNITIGLQGKAATEAAAYVDAIKTLLNAYTSTFRNFKKLVAESKTAFVQGDTANAGVIEDEATNIKNDAAKIRVD